MKTIIRRYAIVTGGARGIGKAITKKLMNDGFIVLICSRDQTEIDKTRKELDPSNKKIFGIVSDVSVYKDCKKLIDFAKTKFKQIDVLVNNAGIYGPIGPVETNPTNEWVHAMEINFFGTLYCSQLVIPLMKKQKAGKIINMAGAGVGNKRPLARFSAYYTSKTAVVGFTEAIAAELKEFNIQVNCISPGGVNTRFTDNLLKQGVGKAGIYMYEQALKQKKTGGDSPVLAANLVSYLASVKSNNVTGKMLSAKWDSPAVLNKLSSQSDSLFTLRRIDNALFYEKK